MPEKTKTVEKKLEVIELGYKKIKEREEKKKLDAEERNKRRIEEEIKLMERIDKDDLSPSDLVLLKRMKNRLKSEAKIEETKERAKAEKVFKVHLKDAKAPPVIVKATTKAEAIEKTKAKGAFRAFEVDADYKLNKTG